TNGRVTYEVIHGMKYLDAVICETMRLYPLVSFLDRVCIKKFELPPALPGGKPFTMEPGMNLWVPVMPIHKDPNYYENPNKFDPDRFMEDGKKLFNSYIYLPFGVGPRICIGSRFAMIKMKVLLCYLFARFDVKAGAKTNIPMQLKKGFTAVMPKNGFWVKLEPRKDPHPSLANGLCC
ncbi:cytochrome P450 9e2-like, partial [Ceratina calcarata]